MGDLGSLQDLTRQEAGSLSARKSLTQWELQSSPGLPPPHRARWAHWQLQAEIRCLKAMDLASDHALLGGCEQALELSAFQTTQLAFRALVNLGNCPGLLCPPWQMADTFNHLSKFDPEVSFQQ